MNKLIQVSIFLSFIFIKTNAQVAAWEWAKTATCSHSCSVYGLSKTLASDASGNFYLAQLFKDTITFGAFTLTGDTIPGDTLSLYITKYNSSGNVIWAKKYGDLDIYELTDITTNALGNIFITGYFNSSIATFGTDTLINSGSENTFLVKIDSSGNILWAKSGGGTGSGAAYNVSADINGNSYITGIFSSPTFIFGTDTLTNIGTSNIFLAKYDSNGNVIWAKSAGGTVYDNLGTCSAIDSYGNICIAGAFYSAAAYFGSDSIINQNPGSYNIFIAKYDSGGNVIWAKAPSGFQNWPREIASDPFGNIVMTGEFGSSLTFDSITIVAAGFQSYFLVKYDSAGNVIWANTQSGGNNDNSDGYGLAVDALGNAYVIGEFDDGSIFFGSIGLPPMINDYFPMYIAKFDSSGHAVYAFELPANISGVAIGNQPGTVYIGGNFGTTNLIIGHDTLIPSGLGPPYVAKIGNSNVGIPSIELLQNVYLFPNPNSGNFILHYHLNSTFKTSFQVTDITGRIVYNTMINGYEGTQVISVPDLCNGIYYWQLLSENGIEGKGKIAVIK